MSWLDKRFKDFDPRSADAFDCWAVVQMETEGYVRINRGKITVTGKGHRVAPKFILRQRPPRWNCNLSKAMLVMEQDGLLTVRNGNIGAHSDGPSEVSEPRFRCDFRTVDVDEGLRPSEGQPGRLLEPARA